MTIYAVQDDQAFSVGFKAQSDVNTIADGAYEYIDATFPKITPIESTVDEVRAIQSRGSVTPIKSGHRWYNIAFSVPAHGQAAAFAYASDTPDFVGATGVLCRAFGGSNAIAYAATDVSPNSTNGNKIATAAAVSATPCGSLIAFGSGGTIAGVGIVESVSGSYLYQCREDMAALPGSGVKRYATKTAFPEKATPTYYTLTMSGEDLTRSEYYIGCVLSKCGLRWAGDIPFLDYEFIGYGGTPIEQDDGILHDVTSYLPLEPMTGRGGGRVTLASNLISTLDDGTADPYGSDDVCDLAYSFEFRHKVVPNPSGTEGVGAVRVMTPIVMASFWTSRNEGFTYSAQVDLAEYAFRNAVRMSLNMFMGDTAGRLFAVLMPSGIVKKATPTLRDGIWGTAVELHAGHYTGDQNANGAGNKPCALVVG